VKSKAKNPLRSDRIAPPPRRRTIEPIGSGRGQVFLAPLGSILCIAGP
jgi:hypothetical protein